VLTLDPHVNIPGAYLGSRPHGKNTGTVIPLSFTQALRDSIEFNLGGIGTTQDARAARSVRLQRLAQLTPEVYGSLRGQNDKRNQTNLGLDNPLKNPLQVGPYQYYELQGELRQNLFDKPSIDAFKAAKAGLTAARLNELDARDMIVLAVSGSYLHLLAAAARVRSSEVRVRTTQRISEQAQDRLAVGATDRLDVVRSQVENLTEQERLRAYRADYARFALELGRLIGLPDGQQFVTSDFFGFKAFSLFSVEQAIEQAKSSRADLRSAHARVVEAQAALSSAKAEYLPSVRADLIYGAVGVTPVNGSSVYSIGATASVPIFDRNRIHGEIVKAQAAVEQREAEQEDLEAQVAFQVRTAFIDLSAAADEVAVAQRSVDLASETLRRSRERFEAGAADAVEVVQAEQQVAQADNDVISALYAHNLAKMFLARSLGQAETRALSFLQ
jgi:outer membrane protein TolC